MDGFHMALEKQHTLMETALKETMMIRNGMAKESIHMLMEQSMKGIILKIKRLVMVS